MHIIAQNEWLIALDKPSGLIVHSDGRTVEPNLANELIERWPELESVGEPWISPQGHAYPLPGIVHRLDRTTSGIMIVAKTQEAWEYLKGEFKARRVEKTYRAIVYGHVETAGVVSAEIARTKEEPRRWYAIDRPIDHIRTAITEYRLLKELDEATYTEFIPKTGRTHQIRVHAAHIGHPIVGDHLYAADHEPILGFTRPALHAYSLSLALPDGTPATFSAPLPTDFEHALMIAKE